MIRIVKTGDRRIEKFNARPAFPEEAEKAAASALAEIKARGDAAVLELVAKFEGFKAKNAKALKVDLSKVSEKGIDSKIVRAVKDAHRRVLKFSKASLRGPWSMKSPRGGALGEFYSPMDRVGVYIPGGTAPLASTSVMTVTLAKAAGVKEIVACTPAGATGEVNPVLLYALKLAGATEVYRVGGIQAIGMMAFGTKICKKVQKIAGPLPTVLSTYAGSRQTFFRRPSMAADGRSRFAFALPRSSRRRSGARSFARLRRFRERRSSSASLTETESSSSSRRASPKA